MGEEEPAPKLRLSIIIDRPTHLRQTARIFERVPIAFDQHLRDYEYPQQVELRLADVKVGSLYADFVGFAGTAVTLWEFRELLVGFVERLSNVFAFLTTGVGALTATSAERKAIDALAAPIANDNATQVSLQVIGDNNVILVLTPETVAQLIPEPVPLRPQRLKDEYRETPLPARIARPAGVRQERLTSLISHTARGISAPVRNQKRQKEDERVWREDAERAGEVVGRLSWLDGKWYVRLQGTDTLVPVYDSDRARGLPKNRAYLISGSVITDEEGRPIGFDARTLRED